jgi:hypothetical protein
MTHRYNATVYGVKEWASHELEHMGRIASLKDSDIQYAYALSTVNGMMHLRQAILELVNDSDYAMHKNDLQKTHDAVVRAIKHLIKDYDVNLDTIKAFNTRHVINSYNFLNNTNNNKRNATNNNKRNATNNNKRNTTNNNKRNTTNNNKRNNTNKTRKLF